MEKQVFLSIILPVYNVEAYIRICVDSILSQPFGDYELILVDDASPDDCAAICDEYAVRDRRVKVIHKENGGISDARNAGTRAAKGKYILFVDPDDWIAENSLDKIYAGIMQDGDCDVTFLKASSVENNGAPQPWTYSYDKNRIYRKPRSDVIAYISKVSRFPVSPCIKLLRRDFVIANNLHFTVGLIHEDVDHMIEMMLVAETFNCFDFDYYVARKNRAGSIMTAKSGAERRFDSTVLIIQKWVERLKRSVDCDFILKVMSVQYIYLIAKYHYLSRDARKHRKLSIRDFAWLMKHGNPKLFFPVRVIRRVLGIRITAVILAKLLSLNA